MKSLNLFLAGLFLVVVLTACAAPTRSISRSIKDPVLKVQPHSLRREPIKKNLFVIIEDPDGKTGSIAVGNEEGAQVIAQPRLASEVKDASTPPNPPEFMSEEDIQKIFGAALAALPKPSVTFTLHFKRGSTAFTEGSMKTFPLVLAAVNARELKDVTVAGHTDRAGAKEKNYILSRSRAQRVKEILVSKGIPPAGVEIEWYGEDYPLIETPDEVAEPRNRRAEVTVR